MSDNISSSNENENKPTIKREREYYETSYLEFMRFKIPKTEDFIQFVNNELLNADYHITDHLSVLTKDTKCCILNYLNIYDICILAMTCNEYASMTNNPKYDEYWRNRFKKRYSHYYVDKNGFFTYRKKTRSILWFDAYQYVAIRNAKASERHNRRTFHTFVKWKRQSKFPQSFKNDIRTSKWSTKSQIISEYKLIVDTKLLEDIQYDFKNRKRSDKTEVLYDELCNAFYSYAGKNCRSCTSIEDVSQIREDYNNGIRDPKKCLLHFDDEFSKKWGFDMSDFKCKCQYPYKSYYSNRPMDTGDEIYHASYWKDCVKQIINGPIIKPLYNELLKYGIDFYNNNNSYY